MNYYTPRPKTHSVAKDIMQNAMLFDATMVLDSVSEAGVRICTVEANYWRGIHSELLTHRVFARNSASSRAISWSVMKDNIKNRPFVPVRFGREQRGMMTGAYLEGAEHDAAVALVLKGRDQMLEISQGLADLGVHKSLCNRYTEPWMFIRVVITATEWDGFFMQRVHPEAELHMQIIAEKIHDAISGSTPKILENGQWHLPYVTEPIIMKAVPWISDNNGTQYDARYISTARAAGVSFLKHGTGSLEKDMDLALRLKQGSGFGHRSPSEHVAQAKDNEYRSGPFRGWRQFRKELFDEGDNFTKCLTT